eukprot:TRINITY_DN14975_c0_g1_i1.p1 TRINITY_DN14975_c0_g1~~TRINITY_DN14975_c0_g1_i1.p1  ORF type:complete len:175 (-),score=16.53 TRINITY_DN14975_c0_g1_i1:371-850(-)
MEDGLEVVPDMPGVPVLAAPRHSTSIGLLECDDAETCSSCSVLSTGTETWTITEHVNQLLEPIRRRNEECAGYLERRSLDGTWVCNLHASEAPAAVARWARVLHINGRRVVLGDGEDAVLQMVDGHIMLDKGRLVRVGSKLLRFGRTSKLVYELLYANT